MSFTLRPYQSRDVERLRGSYRSERRAPLYVLPTGGGKTAVFSYIAMGARERGRRAMILVHRQELLTQASSSLARLGVDHGIISPRYTQTRQAVQIASVQTLVGRLGNQTPPDLIIVDEAHHATAKSYREIIAAYPKAKVLGVTATPIRSDGDGLGKDFGGIFDDLILGPSITELINAGHLVRPIVHAPDVGADLSGMSMSMGDYSKRDQAFRMNRPTITGCAIDHYIRLCPGVPAIVFCSGVEHAENVAAQFRERGFRAVSVDGGMNDLERRRAIEGLGNGSVDLLTSADLIGEGVDVPACGAVIQLRRTMSKALWLQQIGRALRPSPGKECAYVLDHVDNVGLHGYPTWDQEWTLEGSGAGDGNGGGGPGGVKLSQCASEPCRAIFERGPEICPECDEPLPSKTRGARQVEGELAPVDEQKLREKREQARARARVRKQRADASA
ncbi:MAG: DEAD/DEAH box helicase [Kiritimatiellia bacterium]